MISRAHVQGMQTGSRAHGSSGHSNPTGCEQAPPSQRRLAVQDLGLAVQDLGLAGEKGLGLAGEKGLGPACCENDLASEESGWW